MTDMYPVSILTSCSHYISHGASLQSLQVFYNCLKLVHIYSCGRACAHLHASHVELANA